MNKQEYFEWRRHHFRRRMAYAVGMAVLPMWLGILIGAKIGGALGAVIFLVAFSISMVFIVLQDFFITTTEAKRFIRRAIDAYQGE